MLRAGVLARRGQRSAADLAAAGGRLAEHAAALWSREAVVAAHAGVGSEPPTRPLLDRLCAAGVQVLLPIVTVGRPDLGWGRYDGWDRLVAGPFGLLQPAGPLAGTGPLPGADPLSAVAVVLVPALAVDAAGRRLGRGGGYYDRLLATVDPSIATVAVVFDDEVVDVVPTQPHDIAVSMVLTPSGLRAV